MKNPLLRFLNKNEGPIIRLTTSSFGSNGEFLYSFATLSSEITKGFRNFDILKFGGSGWSIVRLISQEKAITEAIERWAFKYFLDSSATDAGIDLDNTSNGFSALPKSFKIEDAFFHSYCECIERYLLSRFADNSIFKLKPLELSSPETSLFESYDGAVASYLCPIKIERKETNQFFSGDMVYFIMSLFWIKDAGVVVGSACGQDLNHVYQKSLQECYIHLLASEKLKNESLPSEVSITDKRLKNFAESPEHSLLIQDRLNYFCNTEIKPKIPNIAFIKELPGKWNPEVHVVRVLLENTTPLTEGDEWRFLI